MRRKFIILFLAFLIGVVAFPEESHASDWKHYQRGVQLMEKGNYNAAIIEFKKAIALSPKASTYRKLAISYEKTNQFQRAAETYYAEAQLHLARGDKNTYQATKNLGDALNTEIDLFTNQHIQLPTKQLAKYEPEKGMYVGAYLEQSGINQVAGGKYKHFNQKTNKQHAIFLNYHRYGNPFPVTFPKEAKEAGAAIQLALQPDHGLSAVKDDAYLRQFARDAKASGVPIFLRFASEMNGSWVPWHGNPQLYREKFALVSKVMKEEAPNVAMVWVPNSVPLNNIDAYYPGDHAVDWVGINLYSVPFFNGNPKDPADHVNPLHLIDEFYKKYAVKKPMMIGETASSHYSSAINREVTNFGVTKMRMFYHGLQMKYPNVKAIHWFNVDTMSEANISADRRLNNFNLLHNSSMLQAYSQMMKDSFFLSRVENGPSVQGSSSSNPKVTIPLENGSTIFNSVNGMGFMKTYDPTISKVVYLLNNQKIKESKAYPFDFTLNHQQMRANANTLTAIVYDSKGREAGRKSMTLHKGPHLTKSSKNTLLLFVDDKTVFTEDGASRLLASVYQKQGRSLVPLRFVSETLGASVKWDGKNKKITISKGNQTIVLTEGSRVVYVNNQKQTIDVAAEIKNGTTFVPLRFVTEILGAAVQYDSKTKGIEIKF